jgi:hypothetical protein
MGFDWPASPLFFGVISLVLIGVLWVHARNLLKSAPVKIATRLVLLRIFSLALLLALLARPFLEQENLDQSKFRLLTLVDFSGSMEVRDDRGGKKRNEQIRPYLEYLSSESWIAKQRQRYGKVEMFAFSEERERLHGDDWNIPQVGSQTALGDALSRSLAQAEDQPDAPLGSLVVFSDGRNNTGRNLLEVGNEFRARGIPINVIGVGEDRPQGDLKVTFSDRKPRAVAKEDLLLKAKVTNEFSKEVSTRVSLFMGDEKLRESSVNLKPGVTQEILFDPIIPQTAGARRYRVAIEAPDGDVDPANDLDTLLVEVKPPLEFSILYLSNQPRPLYPFIKRSLSKEEQFDFQAIIRLGENVFHAVGEGMGNTYPADQDFWMSYDAVLADTDALDELNATVAASLKSFVQKKGGGLLLFGPLDEAREILGGLVPVKAAERVVLKQDVSLRTLEEPLFGPEDDVDEMKPFLPGRLPGYLVTQKNPASRGVVVVRSSGESILAVQAYGAGKVAYWGSPHDWRRSLRDEDGNREFERFWQALAQWLGTGGEERMKVAEESNVLVKGAEASLQVEALGSDFEPSVDAMVVAEISGPGGFSEKVQLYPRGAVAGQYAGNFRPEESGAYEVSYQLSFPDGEKLEKNGFVRVGESGLESKDTTFAERDLQMLAKITGGEYLHISDFDHAWEPKFAENLPTLKKRKNLADAWPIFIALFLAAGIEWVMRRQVGLR